jgi:WD40 repeat protein
VAGTFNDVKIIDLSTGQKNSESLPTGDSAVGGKSVSFTDDGRLLLRLQFKIIGWEVNTWKPISWKQKIQVESDNGKLKASVNHGLLGDKDYFEYEGKEFSCMTVFQNKIVLGIDSGVIIINRDSLFKIKSNDVDKTSSIEFDPAGKYLFIGDNSGTLCRMSLADFSTENNQYQTARISDITFNNDGNFMASSSFDGSTAIWDMKNNWSSLTPLVLLPPGQKSFIEDNKSSVYCVAFSNHSDYVLAGYFNGKILKWPVNMDILADLICSHANASLNTSNLKKVIKREVDFKKIIKYSCNANSVVK